MRSILYIIIYCLSIFVCSCNKKGSNKEFYVLGNKIDTILVSNDSLYHVYKEEVFKRQLDTLKFYGPNVLVTLSIIEFSCSSCYSVTNLKYLLLQYQDFGMIYLFKYNYQNSAWNLMRSVQKQISDIVAIDSIMKNGILKGHTNTVRSDAIDLMRYGTLDLRTNRIETQLINKIDPDSWNRILYLTTE